MASWNEIEAEAPDLAAEARRHFDAFVHKTIATIRKDGSPRISGTEVEFADGELYVGVMPGAVRLHDIRRDPRFALHSGSADPPAWAGDAKLAGTLVEVETPGASRRFRAYAVELVVVSLDDARDELVITSWHAGRGVTRIQRR